MMYLKSCFAIILLLIVSFAQGQDYTVLHYFSGSPADGCNPNGQLATDGTNLYGTTSHGGNDNVGTIFSIGRSGESYSILRSFANDVIRDGMVPFSGPTLSGSTLYGTTFYNNGVYSINTDGSAFKILHTFYYGDGLGATGGLVLSGSKLYGTTQGGGPANKGIIFSLNLDGSGYQILHTFNGTDGQTPQKTLILDGTKLYGTTSGGTGTSGEVFSFDTISGNFNILHTFGNLSSEASGPSSSLTLCGSTLYGTTWAGGRAGGTIYSLNTSGNDFHVLHQFTSIEGAYPQSGLTLVGSTFFGTAYSGASSNGVIYSIDMDGDNYRILHTFDGTDGKNPSSDLICVNSTLYGTASQGGINDSGVVYALTIPEPSTIALLGMGGIGLIAYGWRRRKV
jgi:uncharacterized repeat protein (TIGR03803 family)